MQLENGTLPRKRTDGNYCLKIKNKPPVRFFSFNNLFIILHSYFFFLPHTKLFLTRKSKNLEILRYKYISPKTYPSTLATCVAVASCDGIVVNLKHFGYCSLRVSTLNQLENLVTGRGREGVNKKFVL